MYLVKIVVSDNNVRLFLCKDFHSAHNEALYSTHIEAYIWNLSEFTYPFHEINKDDHHWFADDNGKFTEVKAKLTPTQKNKQYL